MLCSTSSIPTPCQWLPRRPSPQTQKTSILIPSYSPPILSPPLRILRLKSKATRNSSSAPKPSDNKKQRQQQNEEVEEIQVEEDMPWIQDKALDLVEFTGAVTQKIPGPRVGQTSLPWVLALAFTYAGVSFVIAVFKTVKKFNSPRAKRRQLVNQNATLIKSIDEVFKKGREELQHWSLQDLVKKTGFDMEEILRKYIRYALNEKPFNGDLVADLIQLRKASMLTDSQVAETLNEISRRIVKDKGPVVMDASGYSEKGFKRKLAVQALFGKVFYLSELPEFCSRDSSLIVKEIFGVTDEDADKLRIHTLSDVGDMEALERMAEGGSGLGDSQTFEDTSGDVGFDDVGDSSE